MIVDYEENNTSLNKNTYITKEYADKKKALESALDELLNRKSEIKIDINYDPDLTHKKKNISEQKMKENEEKAFNFLKEFCDTKNDINEYENLNDNIDNKIIKNEIREEDANYEMTESADICDEQPKLKLQKKNKTKMENDPTFEEYFQEDNSSINIMDIDTPLSDTQNIFKKSIKNMKKRQVDEI